MKNYTNQINNNDQLDTNSSMDEILIKYNLQEDPDKAFQKIMSGIEPNRAILGNLVKDIIDGKITTKVAYAFLQKSLSVSVAVAKNITDDIQSTVVPKMKMILNNLSQGQQASKLEEKTIAIQVPKVEENKKINNANTINKLPKKTIQTEKPKSNGPDNYREPIE